MLTAFNESINQKHAYLIMAHDNWQILSKLIRLIDDPRHDIFLHIDAKANRTGWKAPELAYSNLTEIKSERVYWADYSQVKIEIRLLKAAGGSYSYYHLLSGTDMPLKTNDERFCFFEKSGKNFIAIVPKETQYALNHVKYFHPMVHCALYRNSKMLKAAERVLELIQHALGVNRVRHTSWHFVDGWTWFSIDNDLCSELIRSETRIERIFQSSMAGDEMFVQTFVFNSPDYLETLYDNKDLKRGSMRFIDWDRGKPYTFGADDPEADYTLLMNSPYMFARKFSEPQSLELVDSIYNTLMKKQQDNKA